MKQRWNSLLQNIILCTIKVKIVVEKALTNCKEIPPPPEALRPRKGSLCPLKSCELLRKTMSNLRAVYSPAHTPAQIQQGGGGACCVFVRFCEVVVSKCRGEEKIEKSFTKLLLLRQSFILYFQLILFKKWE